MLKAILSGKAGRVQSAVPVGASWRDVFRGNEDLLTATVFERLAYLDPAELLRVLNTAFDLGIKLDARVELRSMEFWPAWRDVIELRTVEPDVFIQFEQGNARRYVDIIVEAKLGGAQYSQQWFQQTSAYFARLANSNGLGVARDVYFIGVGGVGRSGPSTKESMSNIAGLAAAVTFGWGNWLDIAEALETCGTTSSARRITADILAAMEQFGIMPMKPLSDLTQLSKIENFETSMAFVQGLSASGKRV